jgi:cytochrome c
MMKKAMLALSLILAVSAVHAAKIDLSEFVRPEGTSAPEFEVERADMVAKGEALWNDPSLSKKGKTSCASCHKGNTRMFKKTFLQPYPHMAKMPLKKGAAESVSVEDMIQFCMIVPMKAQPFPWDSEDLAALVAYTEDVVQPAYIEKKGKK